MSRVRFFVKISGTVQGVGMRPFILRLAENLNLSGFVCNTSRGVSAQVEGEENDCLNFVDTVRNSPPAISRVESVEYEKIPLENDCGFEIRQSKNGNTQTYISPDIGICKKCTEEILDPANKRYAYPFTNCTDCGPRFSIIDSVPYDRKNTAMSGFEMCSFCHEQYENPHDRRFHAQPIACPECGPKARFFCKDGEKDDIYAAFDEYISGGLIVAVKGIGGYHLACDTFNENAVSRLRLLKQRYAKPLAVMCRDIETVKELCVVDEYEEKLLSGSEKPIVLLKKRTDCAVAQSVAPGNKRLGIMLPYTPLHVLLMRSNRALVMTSANYSDMPMIYGDEDVLSLIGTLCDAVITHNRPIRRRVDDSVMFSLFSRPRFIRRARGFAPFPVNCSGSGEDLLCCSAQQKSTFCLVKGDMAFISSHMGDLDYEENSLEYEKEISSFVSLFDGQPKTAVCDLHPDYVSTRYTEKSGMNVIRVQHHHAHFACVLGENSVQNENCLGFIFDGTGYGTDGAVWGGEVLLGNAAHSERAGHFDYFRLPGNEAAVKNGYRTAAYLANAAGCIEKLKLPSEYKNKAEASLKAALAGINSPLCSSAGRIFDALSAISGVCLCSQYEGQGAVMLEQAADMSSEGEYEFKIHEKDGAYIFDWKDVIRNAVEDRLRGVPASVISARFHKGLIRLIVDFSVIMRNKYSVNNIALGGGCFQNIILLSGAVKELENKNFNVYINERLPANDGGISYGQAVAARCGYVSCSSGKNNAY